MTPSESEEKLWNIEFAVVALILFCCASGLAIFFDFHKYLESLQVPPSWIGPLIGADGLSGLAALLWATLMLRKRHIQRAITGGAVIFWLSLWSYLWVDKPLTILLVRLLHGCGFALLLAALTLRLSKAIPRRCSGTAFGIIALARLLPYAVIPPLLNYLSPGSLNFRSVVFFSAVFLTLLFPMIFILGRPKGEDSGTAVPHHSPRDLWRNLRQRTIAFLLAVCLLMQCSYVIVFFYINVYARRLNLSNPGLFFGVASLLMILTRLAGAALGDRFEKRRLVIQAHLPLLIAFGCLAVGRGEPAFLSAAFLFGVGWGVGMPQLNALLFDRSRPEFRGPNLNTSMIAIQVGFFLGPLGGGAILARFDYGVLFHACAVLSLLSIFLLLGIPRELQKERE